MQRPSLHSLQLHVPCPCVQIHCQCMRMKLALRSGDVCVWANRECSCWHVGVAGMHMCASLGLLFKPPPQGPCRQGGAMLICLKTGLCPRAGHHPVPCRGHQHVLPQPAKHTPDRLATPAPDLRRGTISAKEGRRSGSPSQQSRIRARYSSSPRRVPLSGPGSCSGGGTASRPPLTTVLAICDVHYGSIRVGSQEVLWMHVKWRLAGARA